MPRVLATLLFALATLPLSAQTNGSPARYTATAMDMNRGRSGTIELVINRWSTEAERDRLLQVAFDKGPEKLLDALQDVKPVGYIRTPDSIGWDLRFARRTPMPEGGERVVVVTDRRISFWEAANQPRSIDYPFTFIELHLNREGEGEGKMSLATRIIPDKENKIITLENWDAQPVTLTQVRREKASR